jgi:hypothetical protein
VFIDHFLNFKGFPPRFWARAIQTASPSSQRHFLETFTAYLRAVVVEALDREQSHTRSIDDYFKLRRLTVGAHPSFTICEMGMDLPDEVFYNPVIMELAECSTDLILIDNVKWHLYSGLRSANNLHRTSFRTTKSKQLEAWTTT